MKSPGDTVVLHTEPGQRFLDVTRPVRDAIGRSGVQDCPALMVQPGARGRRPRAGAGAVPERHIAVELDGPRQATLGIQVIGA